jgi:hypothetical protein
VGTIWRSDGLEIHYAMVRPWGAGAPALPVVVPLEGITDRVEFTLTLDGKPHRFSAEHRASDLIGTLGDQPVHLRRVGDDRAKQ